MSEKQPILNNVTYDVIKDIVTLGFPGLTVLYSGLALVWEWPFSEQVTASGALLVTFLGIVLKISGKRYEKQTDGYFVANDPNPLADTFRTEFNNDLDSLSEKGVVRLKVVDLLDDYKKSE